MLAYANPGGTLQERKESIATIIQRFGFGILDELVENMSADNEGFLVVEEIA